MDLAGFALAVLIIELTPGPNMAWLAGLAATEGRRNGLAAVAGIAIGLLCNGLLAALGLAALLQSAPGLWVALRLGGAAMMAMLALSTWRSAGRAIVPHKAARGSSRNFGAGLLINLLNPKAYVFFLVVAPQFMNGSALHLREAIILSLVSAGIATIIHIAIVIAGDRAHAWIKGQASIILVRRVFAVIMLCMAASFAASDLGTL